MADVKDKLPPITYTTHDLESILQLMIDQIPNLTDRWTDLNTSDPGIVILELLSWALDGMGFKLDRQANESFLATAQERKNVINLCKLINYRLDGITSSTTLLNFSLESPHTERINISKWSRVATTSSSSGLDADRVVFSTTSPVSIPIGDNSVLVGAKQGEPFTDTFTATGEKSQTYRLTNTDIDTTSIEVLIDGILFAQVDSFIGYNASDRVFTSIIDELSNVNITFGDGFFGYSPPESTIPNLGITYLTSIGDLGNVGVATISTVIEPILDVEGGEVSIAVQNVQSATGGTNEETLDNARSQGPSELSALFRAMTKYDFIALSDGYPGVGKANCWGEQEVNPPNYNLFNWVMVVIAPDGVSRAALISDESNGIPSDELKSDVLRFLNTRSPITTRIKMESPSFVPIDIEANVFNIPTYDSSNVKAEVESAILEWLHFNHVDFGKDIRKSNLIRLLDGVSGVEYIELTKFNTTGSVDPIDDVIVLNSYELPYVRDLNFTVSSAIPLPEIPDRYPCPPDPPIS